MSADPQEGEQAPKPKSNRGFASMSPEKRREIAAKGGKAAHAMGRAHKWTFEEASAAGKKGGGKTAELYMKRRLEKLENEYGDPPYALWERIEEPVDLLSPVLPDYEG